MTTLLACVALVSVPIAVLRLGRQMGRGRPWMVVIAGAAVWIESYLWLRSMGGAP